MCKRDSVALEGANLDHMFARSGSFFLDNAR
jgi:hypothetical protein